jgi:hypothetical protein
VADRLDWVMRRGWKRLGSSSLWDLEFLYPDRRNPDIFIRNSFFNADEVKNRSLAKHSDFLDSLGSAYSQ